MQCPLQRKFALLRLRSPGMCPCLHVGAGQARTMPLTSKQRAQVQKRVKRRQAAATGPAGSGGGNGGQEASTQSPLPPPKAPERNRYRRDDCFERDTLFTIPHATAENDLYDDDDNDDAATAATPDPSAAVAAPRSEAPAATEATPISKEAALAARDRVIAERMQQLEAALPPNARKIDNLSKPDRPGELEPQKTFRGSIVDYAFKLVKEAEAADAYRMRAERQQDWNAWHETMYKRHERFSATHYKLFRWLIEKPMDEGLFKTLLMWRMVEHGKISAADCDKLVSEYHAIHQEFPNMRRYIEKERERAERRARGETVDSDTDGEEESS